MAIPSTLNFLKFGAHWNFCPESNVFAAEYLTRGKRVHENHFSVLGLDHADHRLLLCNPRILLLTIGPRIYLDLNHLLNHRGTRINPDFTNLSF